jgi:hypothetical protein
MVDNGGDVASHQVISEGQKAKDHQYADVLAGVFLNSWVIQSQLTVKSKMFSFLFFPPG